MLATSVGVQILIGDLAADEVVVVLEAACLPSKTRLPVVDEVSSVGAFVLDVVTTQPALVLALEASGFDMTLEQPGVCSVMLA